MRIRAVVLVAGLLLASCGGRNPSSAPTDSVGDSTSTTASAAVSTTTTSPEPTTAWPQPADDSLTNVWLIPAEMEKPSLVASAEPDRLWLFSVVPAGKGMALVQGDDQNKGFLSYYEGGKRRWQQQFDDYVMSAAFVGDAVVAAVRVADGASTDLVVYPTADGALLQHATLPGALDLRTIGGSVYLLEEGVSRVTVARLDPKTLAAVDALSVPGGGSIAEVDQGLLSWTFAGTDLIDLASWSTTHWAAGVARDAVAPAVVGKTLARVGSGGEVVGLATDGSQEWSVTGLGSGITRLAGLGAKRLAVATDNGVALVDVDGGNAAVVDRWEGAGTMGPTAVIDGRGYLVWFVGTTGHLLADSGNGWVELATFQGGTKYDGPTGATFADGALYVTAATDSEDPGPASEVPLTALSLKDGHELWSIRPTIDVKANVRWALESGAIVVRYGYGLIPGLVEVYG